MSGYAYKLDLSYLMQWMAFFDTDEVSFQRVFE